MQHNHPYILWIGGFFWYYAFATIFSCNRIIYFILCFPILFIEQFFLTNFLLHYPYNTIYSVHSTLYTTIYGILHIFSWFCKYQYLRIFHITLILPILSRYSWFVFNYSLFETYGYLQSKKKKWSNYWFWHQ